MRNVTTRREISVECIHSLGFQDRRERVTLQRLRHTRFMNTYSIIIDFKKIGAYSKIFVECIICFGELEETSLLLLLLKQRHSLLR